MMTVASMVIAMSFHAPPLVRPLPIARAPMPRLQIGIDFDALQNTGQTAVFDNVNVATAATRFLRSVMNSNKERLRLKEAVLSLSSGVDEIIFIAVYLLLPAGIGGNSTLLSDFCRCMYE